MNLTGCEIRFVLFGPDGRVEEWSLTLSRVREDQVNQTISDDGRYPTSFSTWLNGVFLHDGEAARYSG